MILRHRLSSHHSKDRQFIQRINKELMVQGDPWRCVYCKKISKANANGCNQCLIGWQECQDTTFVPPSKQQKYSQQQSQSQSSWDWNSWDYYQAGDHTPRTPKGSKVEWQQPKSPRQGKGKGKGKGTRKEQWKGQSAHNQQKGQTKDQGKDKGKGRGASSQGSTMIPPEPPWTPSLSSATNLAPLPPPTEPPPTTEEGAMLKELLSALKKSSAEQDPEVKAIVQRSTLKEGQGAAQTLYSAVDDLTMAREALDCARLARHNLHIRWRNFLTDAVARWQKHTTDFQKEEQDLSEQIEAARQALVQAVKRFEESKTELGDQAVHVDAEAAMNEDSDNVDKNAVGMALQESLTTMSAQLQSLQASAEAMVTEEANSNKRQRTDGGDGRTSVASGSGVHDGLPSATAPAMQPFADRQKPFIQPDKQ